MRLRSSLRHSFLAATMLMFVPAAAQAETGRFPLIDNTLVIEAPSQYCAVDMNQTFDAQWFDFQSRAQGADNHLVGAFLPCAQLAGLRAGTESNLSTWILVLAAKDGPNSLAYYPDMKDAEFVSLLSAEFEKGVRVDTEETARNIEQAARETGANNNHAVKLEGDGIPRPMGTSDRAVYISLKLDVTEAGIKHPVAAAGGMVLIRGNMITLTTYGDYENERTMSQLLIRTTRMVERAADLNR